MPAEGLEKLARQLRAEPTVHANIVEGEWLIARVIEGDTTFLQSVAEAAGSIRRLADDQKLPLLVVPGDTAMGSAWVIMALEDFQDFFIG